MVVGLFCVCMLKQLLQTKLLCTQDEIDLIASIGNTGLYVPVFAGMVVEQVGFYVVVEFGGYIFVALDL